MLTPKIIFLLINLIGGAAVIGSYVWGLAGKTGGANALWGNAPANIRSVYTASMILSALGYLAVMYFLFFALDLSTINTAVFYGAFLGILLASAFWMPLTNMYVSHSSVILWVAIRVVLLIVGVASIVLAALLISLHAKEGGAAYWLAVVGACYFAFHTAVLDAALWPVLFRE
jgi:hypothetical protein